MTVFNKGVLILLLLLFAAAGPALAQSQAMRDGLRLLEAGDPEGALPYLEQGLDQEPVPEEVYVALAVAYAQTERYLSLRQIADDGLTHYPGQLTLTYFKAELLMQDGDLERAVPLLESLQTALHTQAAPSVVDAVQVRRRLGQAYQVLGNTAYYAGRKQEALDHFKRTRTYLPDSVDVHHNVVILLLEGERWTDALAAVDQSLGRFPGDETLLRMKAQALYHLERFADLVPVYETLYRLRPDDVEIGLVYAQVLRQSDQFDASEAVFDALMTRFPHDRRVYETQADLHEQALNYAQTAEVLRRQRRQFPDDADVLRRLGQTYELLNTWDEARAAYDTLATLTGDTIGAEVLKARTYTRQDSLPAALAAYRGLRAKAPDNLVVIQDQAKLLREHARWREARAAYAAWFAADSSAYARLRWGEALEALGDTASARTAYTDALALGSTHPLPAYRLAVLQRDDTSASCALAEAGLRNALKGVKQVQEVQFGQVQTTDLSGLEDQGDAKALIEEYNAIGEQVFEYYTRQCPPADVEPVLDALLKTYPGAGKLHYLYGRHYHRQGDRSRARFHFREAAQFSPQLLENQMALAALNEAEGQGVQAIIGYERVLTLNPEEAPAYQALIRLYTARNQLDRLVEKWQTRYQATPQNEVLRLYLIESLRHLGRFEEAARLDPP